MEPSGLSVKICTHTTKAKCIENIEEIPSGILTQPMQRNIFNINISVIHTEYRRENTTLYDIINLYSF